MREIERRERECERKRERKRERERSLASLLPKQGFACDARREDCGG